MMTGIIITDYYQEEKVMAIIKTPRYASL